MKRSAGILMPLTALPSPYGIGTIGKSARDFVDYLKGAKQSYWQILPIGPTSYGDSPYSSFSAFAGNPYLIDLDTLIEQGYIKKSEVDKVDWGKNKSYVDYEKIYNGRFPILRIAAKRFLQKNQKELDAFVKKEKYWLEDYATYMAIKNSLNDISVEEWPIELKRKDKKAIKEKKEELKEDIQFYEVIQYLFFNQWNAFKTYANAQGIQLIGDLPIYIARDSADVWVNPQEFQLDENYNPKLVAGVPPDYFAEDGQLWGNPLYDWDKMKKDKYAWWVKRLKQQMRFYDVIRLDHFRGFEAYYTVKAGATTARRGTWKKGPGYDFFKEVSRQLKGEEIIAEDLGIITKSVQKLLDETGYPGMKVLEFAFDPKDEEGKYLPHNHKENNVVYIGTHDNETIMQWKEEADKKHIQKAIAYFDIKDDDEFNWKFIQGAYQSVAKLVIVQFQDILGLGKEARINQPSTIGGNWIWRYDKSTFPRKYQKRLEKLVSLYQR